MHEYQLFSVLVVSYIHMNSNKKTNQENTFPFANAAELSICKWQYFNFLMGNVSPKQTQPVNVTRSVSYYVKTLYLIKIKL